MKAIPSVVLALSLLAPVPLLADDIDTRSVIGSAIGGGLGAFVGSELGGQTGAVLGGALGGAAAAALGDRDSEPRVRREVVYVDRPVVRREGAYGGYRPVGRREFAHRYGPRDRGLHRGHYQHWRRRHHYDDD